MTREQVGWQASVLLHLMICGGFVLLNLNLTNAPQRVVINLSFLSGGYEAPAAAPPADTKPTPVKRVAPTPKKPPEPVVQPLQELSAPLPEAVTAVPSEVVEPALENTDAESTVNPEASEVGNPSTVADAGESAEESQAHYVRAHFSYIRNLIMHRLEYPALARRMGWTGRVVIVFTVCKDGRVEEARVVESSGRELLDRNAVEVVAQAAPFPPPPVPAEIIMPITYALN